MFQSAKFLLSGAGTSSLPAVLLLVHPFGSMLRKRSLRGLSDLLALHASKAELEQIIALTLSRPAFLNKTRIDDDASVCIFPTHFEHEHAYLTGLTRNWRVQDSRSHFNGLN